MKELTLIQKLLLNIPEDAKINDKGLSKFNRLCNKALTTPFNKKELNKLALTSMAGLPVAGATGIAAQLLASSYTSTLSAPIIAATMAAMGSLFYAGVRAVNSKNHNTPDSPQL